MKVIEVPDYLGLSDQELMEWSGEEFAAKLKKRCEDLGENFFHKSGWKVLEQDEEERKKGLSSYCEQIAWLEFYNGVHPPAKQIVMLEKNHEDIGLRIRLAQQVIDEVNHQRIWSKWAKYYGGNPRIQDYPVDEATLNQLRITSNYTDPAEIAASLQLTGEVLLMFLFGYGSLDADESATYHLYPEEMRPDLKKYLVDEEPRHIAVGMDIMSKYCGDATKRRNLINIQNNRMKTTSGFWVRTLRKLGLERVAPMPVIV